MAAAQRAADRERFRAFLREHRYAPQGKLARAGELQDHDIDALLRPGVAPVWRWVWQNVRSAEELDRVRRNVQVAQRQLASCQRERQEAAREVERLEARKAHVLETLRKANERESALLASLNAVEKEKRVRAEEAADRKQRRSLQRAFAAESEAETAQVVERIAQVRRVATTESNGNAPHLAIEVSGDARENPLDVLLREYLRLLNAGREAEAVEFGDRDIEHVRQFGGRTLIRWLQETANRPVGSAATRDGDEQDARYEAHVEERTLSSHDALEQVRTHLRRHQKEHIARFTDTQATYARAVQLNHELHDYEASETAMATNSLVGETVELEMANAVERAALAAAVDSYGKAMEHIEAARKHKLELEHQLEMMDNFDRRQQNVLDHIRAMHAENQSMMDAVAARQQELLTYARAQVLDKYGGGKSGRLLQQRQSLTTEELRRLASTQQRLGDVYDRAFVQSVMIAGSDNDDSMDGTARSIQRDLLIPFAELSINQLKRDSANDRGDNLSNGLDRVFGALGVPSYGNWEALLQRLEELENQRGSDQAEASMDSVMNRLARELQDEERGDAPHSTARATALVEELRHVSNTMEAASFPLLEEAMRANRETSDRIVPRLKELTDDFSSQRGWSVDI